MEIIKKTRNGWYTLKDFKEIIFKVRGKDKYIDACLVEKDQIISSQQSEIERLNHVITQLQIQQQPSTGSQESREENSEYSQSDCRNEGGVGTGNGSGMGSDLRGGSKELLRQASDTSSQTGSLQEQHGIPQGGKRNSGRSGAKLEDSDLQANLRAIDEEFQNNYSGEGFRGMEESFRKVENGLHELREIDEKINKSIAGIVGTALNIAGISELDGVTNSASIERPQLEQETITVNAETIE